MPPLVQIKMQLKNAGINAALLRFQQNTDRLPDYLANKACNSISFRAWQNMPAVSQAAMDQELEVSSHGVTKKGKLSKAKKPKYIAIGSHPSSLGSRIVLASFYPNSPFNIRTGNVFQRMKPGTHGSVEFWNWISEKTSRMVKARHSSGGFYAACARAVNVGFGRVLGKFGNTMFGGGSLAQGGGSDVNKATAMLNRGLGQITPAANGSGRAGFSVATTEPDTKGTPGGAIYRIAQPVWQEAVDAEAQSLFAETERRYRQAAEAAGVHVSV